MIQADAIEAVQAVAHYQNFSLAARHIHKVPSAISYTIRKLEEMLGVQLFVRDNRKVEITPAGEHFLKESHKILADLRRLEYSTREAASQSELELRIVLDNIISQDAVYDFISAFHDANPHTRLVVNGEIYNGSWDALFHQRCHLVIGAPQTIPEVITGSSQFRYRSMGQVDWALVMSPDHPLNAIDRQLTREDLDPHLIIAIEDTARTFDTGENWLNDYRRSIRVPNFRNAIECAVRGLGVTTLPCYFARHYVEQGLLVERDIENVHWNTQCHLAWNEEKREAALNWCLDWLGNEQKLNQRFLSLAEELDNYRHIPRCTGLNGWSRLSVKKQSILAC